MNIALLIVSLLLCQSVFSQVVFYKINLSKKRGTVSEKPRFRVLNPEKKVVFNYRIPHGMANNYSIRNLSIKTDKDTLKIPVLLGESIMGELIMAIDKNSNGDFTDELIKTSPKGKTVLDNTFIDSMILGKTVKDTFYFKYVFERPEFIKTNYENEIENKYFLMIADNNVFSGKKLIDEKWIKFLVYAQTPLDYTDESILLTYTEKISPFFQFGKDEKYNSYKIGDTFLINNTPLRFESFSLSTKSLTLKRLSAKKLINAYPGFYVYNISLKDISNNDIKLNSFLGNFVLLEFWGTWCGPCKQITPKLKLLYEKLQKANFRIIGFAYDKHIDV